MKPQPQFMGKLPVERITLGSVFDKDGVDFASPVLIKHGAIRKPVSHQDLHLCFCVSGRQGCPSGGGIRLNN